MPGSLELLTQSQIAERIGASYMQVSRSILAGTLQSCATRWSERLLLAFQGVGRIYFPLGAVLCDSTGTTASANRPEGSTLRTRTSQTSSAGLAAAALAVSVAGCSGPPRERRRRSRSLQMAPELRAADQQCDENADVTEDGPDRVSHARVEPGARQETLAQPVLRGPRCHDPEDEQHAGAHQRRE